MNVVNEFDNKLLKRRELEVVSNYDSNPGYVRVIKELAEKFKVGEDLIVVRRIGSRFGSHEFLIELYIYEDVDRKNKIEPKKKEKKK